MDDDFVFLQSQGGMGPGGRICADSDQVGECVCVCGEGVVRRVHACVCVRMHGRMGVG
jgi:hypothetical protein